MLTVNKPRVSNVFEHVSKKYLICRYIIRAICFTDQIYNHYSIYTVLLMLIFKYNCIFRLSFFVNGVHTLIARMNVHFAKMAQMLESYFTTMLVNTTFLNQK